MKKKKSTRKSSGININSKSYKSLKNKQNKVNEYLKQAKETLGVEHRAYVATMNKIHLFQRKHGLLSQDTLSATGLKYKDVGMYKELLNSIESSTFINPINYQQHQERQVQFFMDKGWGKTAEEVKPFMDFRNSDIFESIADENLPPSTLLDRAKEYNQGDFTLEEFADLIRIFMRENSGKETDKNDFFNYADKLVKARKDRKDDFNKAVEYYLGDDLLEDYEEIPKFFDFLNNF